MFSYVCMYASCVAFTCAFRKTVAISQSSCHLVTRNICKRVGGLFVCVFQHAKKNELTIMYPNDAKAQARFMGSVVQ